MSSDTIRASARAADVRPLSAHTALELGAVVGMTPQQRLAYLRARDAAGEPTPSKEARRELLDAAFIFVVSELGIPSGAAAQAMFDARVDELYRASLIARGPIRMSSMECRLRAVLLEQKARAL